MPAEEKMANPFPMATAKEIAEWQNNTDPATAAARNIMVRNIHGLFRRPYLRGDCDSAPILQGVRDLTDRCFTVALAIDGAKDLNLEEIPPDRWEAIVEANAEMMAILEQVKESEYVHGQDDDGTGAGRVPQAPAEGGQALPQAGAEAGE